MESLGDDLVLLSIRPDKGRLGNEERIGFGLMGSELVRLAARGSASVNDGRVTVLDAAPTGDTELDAALASLAAARRPPKAQTWVGKPRRGIREAYQTRLARAGAIRIEERHFLGMAMKPRLHVTDSGRVADARARLDAIALSSGPVDITQAAYGGLAHAAGLPGMLYPGRDGRQARKRLAEVAKGNYAASAAATKHVADALDNVHDALEDVSEALENMHDITNAVRAANTAAIHAAVHAANHAASHAAAHSGGGGGAGHGH
jgi:Golgi phosphoprotein 3 (GPP34)